MCALFSIFLARHGAAGQIVTILIHSFGQRSLLNEHQAYRALGDYI